MVLTLRVLLIGIDGATWSIIDYLIERDELPTFKYLIKNGVRGYLESTVPPKAIPAWISISTGLKPEKLGFATYLVRDGYEFKPYFYKYRDAVYIWDILSNHGKNVVLLNIPCIVKAYRVNGCMVCGWLSNRNSLTYPENLVEELDRVCNGYIVDIVKPDTLYRGMEIESISEENIVDRAREMIEKRVLAAKYLLSRYSWDFAFIVFTALDRIQHVYWFNKDIVYEFYRLIDKALNSVLENIDEETIVIIVSDHGFDKAEHIFYVNTWLALNRLLALKWHRVLIASIARVLKKLFTKLHLYRVTKYLDRLDVHDYRELIDWSKTKIFAVSSCGDLYINLKNRFPRGSIDIQNYSVIIEKFFDKIKYLRNPLTNEELRITVYRKGVDVYENSSLSDDLPDLVIVSSSMGIHSIDPSIKLRHLFRFKVFSKCRRGEHRLYGVFIAYGPKIKRDLNLGYNVSVYDITPTILHILETPIPSNLDGRILKEIFE